MKIASYVCEKLVLKMNCFICFINTLFWEAESITIENIIKPGTCNGPMLCSLSVGQYCDTKNRFSLGICIGNYKVGPLAFVDDIADANSRLTLKQSHANALQFSSNKILAINRKSPIENIHVKATTIEKVNEFKYLGDWINSKGNNEASLSKRFDDTVEVISSILPTCKEVRFGMFKTDVKLKLYESMLLPSLLFDAQT